MTDRAGSSLYPRLLGSAWGDVDAVVRAAHLSGERLHAEGTFRVLCGTSALARLIAILLRLPRSSHTSAVRLDVTRVQGGERWHRQFDDRDLVSVEAEGPGRVLTERFGVFEFSFRLIVRDAGLDYVHVATGLRLGPVHVPLPDWLSPHIGGREEAARDAARSRVTTVVTYPLAGFVLSYEGEVQVRGPGSR